MTAYDEGLDASVFETIIITLDESNLSNLRLIMIHTHLFIL